MLTRFDLYLYRFVLNKGRPWRLPGEFFEDNLCLMMISFLCSHDLMDTSVFKKSSDNEISSSILVFGHLVVARISLPTLVQSAY